jgi:hypothetical protein
MFALPDCIREFSKLKIETSKGKKKKTFSNGNSLDILLKINSEGSFHFYNLKFLRKLIFFVEKFHSKIYKFTP